MNCAKAVTTATSEALTHWHRSLGIGLVAGVLVFGGCSSDQLFTSKHAKKNISPAMELMAQTKEQRKNRTAYTFDVNFRQLNDDVDSVLLLERPMQMHRAPMP